MCMDMHAYVYRTLSCVSIVNSIDVFFIYFCYALQHKYLFQFHMLVNNLAYQFTIVLDALS